LYRWAEIRTKPFVHAASGEGLAARTGNATAGTSIWSSSASDLVSATASSLPRAIGSAIDAIAPIIDSGAIGSVPSAS
jgi:hypothetical protein